MIAINDLMRHYVADLEAGDVPAPLGERFTLALVWTDLARLAGEVPPAEVAAFAEEPGGYAPTAQRGSFLAYTDSFYDPA